MDAKQILMNYTTPPGLNDFESLVEAVLDLMPEELTDCCNNLEVVIEDFPDDTIQSDLGVDDVYELLAFFKSGKELSPGVEAKATKDGDVLILFRRPVLDVWCESCEDITSLVREIMIEEIAKAHGFSEDDIDDMVSRHHQQLL